MAVAIEANRSMPQIQGFIPSEQRSASRMRIAAEQGHDRIDIAEWNWSLSILSKRWKHGHPEMPAIIQQR